MGTNLFKRVYIKSEADLPDKVGYYPVHQKGFDEGYVVSEFYDGNFTSQWEWVQAYEYYFTPISREEIIEILKKRIQNLIVSDLISPFFWEDFADEIGNVK